MEPEKSTTSGPLIGVVTMKFPEPYVFAQLKIEIVEIDRNNSLTVRVSGVKDDVYKDDIFLKITPAGKIKVIS